MTNIKLEDLSELNDMLKKQQELEQKVIKAETDLERTKNDHRMEMERTNIDYQNQLSKQKVEHENEVLSLNQGLKLEKQRMDIETQRKIDVAEHKLVLAKKEFEKDKEAVLLQVKQELLKEREDLLEKNYGDLKDEANKGFDRGLKVVTTLVDKLNYQQNVKVMDGNNPPQEVKQIEVDVKK